MSLNYYSHQKHQVNLTFNGKGQDALTDKGREVYLSHHYAYFGIYCGDNYITSYHEGALIFFGLVLEFDSPYDKQMFTEHATQPW